MTSLVPYTITSTSGIDAHCVVVQGTNPGEAKLPAAANAGAILGVTAHRQSLRGAIVAVQKAGIALVIAAEPIEVGAAVNIAGVSGRIKMIDETPGTKINCLGFAETNAIEEGDVIKVFLSFHQRIA